MQKDPFLKPFPKPIQNYNAQPPAYITNNGNSNLRNTSKHSIRSAHSSNSSSQAPSQSRLNQSCSLGQAQNPQQSQTNLNLNHSSFSHTHTQPHAQPASELQNTTASTVLASRRANHSPDKPQVPAKPTRKLSAARLGLSQISERSHGQL